MPGKTIDNNKINIQKRQYGIDAEIVDKCLTNNPNSKKINLIYYIVQKASLKKKLKTCKGK